jgi:hypothetical protein
MSNDEQLAVTLLFERLVPVLSLPELLPAPRSGRPLARQAAWRWVTKGVAGPDGKRVRLEAIRVGRRWMTSVAAVARFFARTTGRQEAPRPPAARAPAPILPSTCATLSALGLDVSSFGGSST